MYAPALPADLPLTLPFPRRQRDLNPFTAREQMSREPSYPDDAPVGNPVGKDENSPSAAESTKESADSKPAGEDKGQDKSRRNRQIATGAAIGIGSAALVAALLYTRSSRRKPESEDRPLGQTEDD